MGPKAASQSEADRRVACRTATPTEREGMRHERRVLDADDFEWEE